MATLAIRSKFDNLLLNKRIVFLSGVCSFIIVFMYLTSNIREYNGHEGAVLVAQVQHTTNCNWDMYEKVPNHFPEGLHSTSNEKLLETYGVVEQLSNYTQPQTKLILLWNSYWKSKALWHKIFGEIVYKRCPQSNCELTTDRERLNQSDAVIFHLVDIPSENYSFPEFRDPKQIWIGMTYEPPYILEYAKIKFKKLNGVFNRTMSYRSDGDIVVRHGMFSKIPQSTPAPVYASNWINSRDSVEQRNFAAGKRRLVAWFASSRNCKSQSGREKYVKELQNYIQVDIFGSCGPYKCGVQKTMRNPYKVEEDDCYMLVSVGYKFVLAFENSLCEDYVTEKLYNHLKLNVVPVVFGASNYSLFAPPNSIIDASQYTPEKLAEYLQILDKNDTLYNQYFKWKEEYAIEAHDGVPLACDLCEQMHNPNWQMEKKVYEQFDRWILSGCRKGYGQE